MARQSATDSLKESIRLLELRQAEEGKLLKEQFKTAYESLKPANLLKNSLKEIAGSASTINSLLEAVAALFSGYIAQKAVSGSKNNVFARFFGLLLQFGVTKLVANHADTIRDFVSELIGRIFKPSGGEAPETETN